MGFEFYEERDFKDTELGPLPVDWKVVRLGEVLMESKTKNKDNEKINVYTVSNTKGFVLSDEFFDKQVYSKNLQNYKVVEENCFAYNPARINVGSIALFTDKRKGLVSPMYVVFRISKEEKLIPQYLFKILKSERYINELKRISKSRGSVRQIVAFNDLCEIPIPLPPLEEQKAIAEVLRSVQLAIEKTEEVIRATKELKKSMMKHLFTYGYVPIDETDKVKLKETEIGLIPEHWEVVRLGEVAETFSGGTPRRDIKEYYGGNIKWLKSGELKDNFIFSTEETITPEGLKNSSAKYVDKGTLLIAMYGATAGKVGYTMERLTINQAICAIKPKIADFYSFFYFYFFQKIRENILSLRYGGAQPNLNQQIISNLSIPLPPLEEQKAIAEVLRAIDDKLQKEEEYKKALQNLFKSLLYHLMSGKIRVRRKTN